MKTLVGAWLHGLIHVDQRPKGNSINVDFATDPRPSSQTLLNKIWVNARQETFKSSCHTACHWCQHGYYNVGYTPAAYPGVFFFFWGGGALV